MNLTQTLRRLSQQSGNGWAKSYDELTNQMVIAKKLYNNNNLDLHMTCGACPEQYEVFREGKQVGYLRLRHGYFRVDFPDCGDETIYRAEPNGDGTFDSNERLVYLARAMRSILTKINSNL